MVIITPISDKKKSTVPEPDTVLFGGDYRDRTEMCIRDRYEWGLSGSANASERRRTFLRILGLPPRLSKKEIIQVLNTLYTRCLLYTSRCV